MKDIQLKLISELLRDSRRSDRELAKVLGISQPTVSRMIKKLREEGIIKEFTVVPDFARIGLGLLTLTFVRLRSDISGEELAAAENLVRKNLAKTPFLQMVMAERGLGLSYDTVIVSIVKDYTDYTKLRDRIKSYPHIECDVRSFIIDLTAQQRYLPFTLQPIAKYLETMQKQEIG